MLTVPRLVAAVALLAALGCSAPGAGDVAGVPRGQGPPSATASPPSAGVKVVDGALGRIVLGARDGWLDVAVERTTVDGTSTTVVRYQRHTSCDKHQTGGDVHVSCPPAWEVRHTLGADAFVLDPLLRTASFTDTLRGSPLMMTWAGSGDTSSTPGLDGHLLVESRRAESDGRWLGKRGVWRRPPSGLYRRHTTL